MIRYFIALTESFRPKAVWWIPASIAKALRERKS